MAGRGNPVRLLVVDDDVSFVTFVCTALEKLGVAADVALSGNDAERRLESAHFAGVLLDLKLPDVPGLEVLRGLRNRGDLTPVVVLTGAGTVMDAVEAMKLGALEFLEKPVRMAELTSAVQLLLSAGSPAARQPGPAGRPSCQRRDRGVPVCC